ncbi:hypothetical protein FRX31_023742 [Thalictrum thalictroides]|uniref:Uncharacterized protein n=1 Tax=Thalictrum thalictroides TaxID=46969 RepID=A0A7J6VR47_THATH|nr:hypothetical protein FRX31_023742 [Thalictrum thalictroides]
MGLRTGYGTEGRSPFPMPSMLADPTPLRARQQTKPPLGTEGSRVEYESLRMDGMTPGKGEKCTYDRQPYLTLFIPTTHRIPPVMARLPMKEFHGLRFKQ